MRSPQMRTQSLAIAALQLPAQWGEPAEQLARADSLLASAPRLDLVLLPEAALTGYVSPRGETDLRASAEPVGGFTTTALAALAAKHEVHVAGPLIESDGGAHYNTTLVVSPRGEIVARYRKRHPWFLETWATPGEEPLPLFEIAGKRVTIATCYDVHFIAAESGDALHAADVLLFPSAWVEEEDSREQLLGELASTFRIAIVNANWGVGAPAVQGQGGSLIVSEAGEVLARAADRPQRICATLR